MDFETDREEELDRLLDLIERHVDSEHCRDVDRRYRRALAHDPVDRPPLIVSVPFAKEWNLPVPWDQFRSYSLDCAFHDPVAMMQNELLFCVIPGLLLRDDSPLSIRNDHGTIQIATLLGACWESAGENPPWVAPLESKDAIRAIANRETELDLAGGGVLRQSFSTLKFYHRKLEKYPLCRQAIQVAMPDLQGPIDTSEQLWGSELFVAFLEEPELVNRLLKRIVDATLMAAQSFRRLATDRLDPTANAQHGYVIPGRQLIRNDTAILLSPKVYSEHVRPHDARLLEQIGGGSIHFCGNGQHLIEPMLEIADLKGLDFGQAAMMDIPPIYRKASKRRVALTNIQPPREDLLNGSARRELPTGVVFVYQTDDFKDARDVVEAYCDG